MRSWRVQAVLCLLLVLGVLAGGITVATQRLSSEHRHDAARALHAAELRYAHRVDALSDALFRSVQPVQDILDRLDKAQYAVVVPAKDAVGHAGAAATVTALARRLGRLDAPRPWRHRAVALHKALAHMQTDLRTLERVRKNDDPSDILDEPYSGAAFTLTEHEDEWRAAVVAVNRPMHLAVPATPLSAGTAHLRHARSATRAGWIFAADQVCGHSGVKIFRLDDPSSGDLAAALQYNRDFTAIIAHAGEQLRALDVPAADKSVLRRSVYGPLHTNDTLVTLFRNLVAAGERQDLTALRSDLAKIHVALRGLGRIADGMRHYGAAVCAGYFDPNGKHSGAHTSGPGGVSA